jgi:hypothetical protein
MAVEFRHDFHSWQNRFLAGLRPSSPTRNVERRGTRGEYAESDVLSCTIIGHSPVDGMQSTDSKGDKSVQISLTVKIEGVKRHSFFDTFPSFAGWCGVRGSSEVTFGSKDSREGKRGSIAKRWSRRTGTTR